MSEEDKITITWDELRTRQVEQRIDAMQAMRRNREYAQLTDAPEPTAAPLKNLWYNAVVYMSIFGLLGGLLAWTCWTGLHFRPSAQLEASELMKAVKDIRHAADIGKISSVEKAAMLENMAQDGRRNPYFAVYSNETLSEAQKQAGINDIARRDAWKEFISNMLAFGVSGMLIAIALSIAEPVVSRNIPSAIINGSVGATLGLLGGVVVATFAERLYHAMGGSDGSITTAQQILARVIQWSVVGLFLSLAPGMVMRNTKKLLSGIAGGIVGGAIGGLLFDVASKAFGNPDIGRLIGLCAIGIVTGAGSALVENAAKSGWLKVTQGFIAGKQFILYRNPTFIGSSPDNQIYLFKDPQVGRRHAALHLTSGGIEVEDLPLGSATLVNGRPVARTRLRSGDQLQIGSTRFVFQERQPSTLSLAGRT